MTENEAKQWLKHTKAYQHKCDNCEYIDIKGACNEECKDFYDMAIQALEEIQQYRAIGTVEEIQQKLKNMSLVIDTDRDLLNRYIAIGTIDEFKALKEKSVAKKPHSISIANDIGNSMVECPICHARSDYDVKSIKRGYCWKCGQKIDWSE